MKKKKRFIAGAVCPKCHAVDSLRWWQELNTEQVECVKCDHQEKNHTKLSPNQLETMQNHNNLIGIFNPD